MVDRPTAYKLDLVVFAFDCIAYIYCLFKNKASSVVDCDSDWVLVIIMINRKEERERGRERARDRQTDRPGDDRHAGRQADRQTNLMLTDRQTWG